MKFRNHFWMPVAIAAASFFLSLGAEGQISGLVWEDNFNDGQLDLTRWNIETGTGVNGDWGTGQLDRARAENVTFDDNVPNAEDGCLVITTKDEFYIDRNYTSGRINTAGKASWGPNHRIVARVFPRDVKQKGQGFAFWMMPDEIPEGWDYIMWPQGGEVDIMEYVGAVPHHNLGSSHYAWFWENNQWQSWNHGHQGAYYSFEHQEVPFPAEPGYGGYPPTPGDPHAGSSGWHRYGVDWFDDRMEFFVDNHVYHIHYFEDGGGFAVDGQDQFTIVTDEEGNRLALSEYAHHFPEWYPYEHKMYVILSAGVGGSDIYTYGGAITPAADFPCSVFVDWVRVYSLDPTSSTVERPKPVEVKAYPNPATETLSVEVESEEHCDMQLVHMNGQLAHTQRFSESAILDVRAWERGPYLLVLETPTKRITKKVVLE